MNNSWLWVSLCYLILLTSQFFLCQSEIHYPWPITTCPPFLFHNIITGFVAGVAQWVPLVTLGLPTILKQINSSPVFSRVHFAQYLVFCLMFCWPLVDFCPLSFGIVYYLSFYLQLPVTPFGICQLLLLKFWDNMFRLYNQNDWSQNSTAKIEFCNIISNFHLKTIQCSRSSIS